ncbi:MAG: D-alanyl-D-alanine carboxypeptidase/D-alanyl-D-alanine-endopeptidase [Candidatus Stahlbacteria bacterium]|nr:D-alanyl-D-alanine carboxypeptidase/D-alanyl-D-alanine-endopeptidase [Candidatus Stahlbacteria bacterium]
MKKILIFLLFLPCVLIGSQFDEKLDSMLQDSILKTASVGIEIADTKGCATSNGTPLYSYNSEKLLVPASNVKIITALAALNLLKPDYRFKTELYYDSLNLYIKGYGDPTLTTDDLSQMAEKVVECGIDTIANIIYDDSYFDKKEIGSGWIEEEESYGFNARVSALSVNKNCIKIFVKSSKCIGEKVKFILYPQTEFVEVINLAVTGEEDSLYVERDKNYIILKGKMHKGSRGETFIRHIDKPSLYTATVFKELLQQKGVKIKGKIVKSSIVDSSNLIYSHYSEPLASLVYDMNKESINFYADQILKTIGAELGGPPGSYAKGISKIEKFLDSLGISESEVKIYDGSGLSRYNLISTKGMVKILLKALEFDTRYEFIGSLPISGTDGTLSGRMRSLQSIRKVRAKTGTMLNVSSLSGYITTNTNNLVAFSIIMNNYTCPPNVIKALQDKIVELIISDL